MSLPVRKVSRRATIAALTAAVLGGTAATTAWAATAPAHSSSSPRTCVASDLYLSMGRKEGAAGSVYWPVTFTNTSTSRCALRGYPGVSVLDIAHRRIGPAASHSGRSYATVTLAPAHSATAVIRTTNGPVGGPCRATGSYLRVYPPASRTAVLVPAAWKVCSGVFQVGPVNTDGTI